MKSLMNGLQPLGRALMLPIAVLPIAGLLLRLGQPDLLDIGFVSAAGDAIFSHLGLLFAIGVATGFARDGNGAACLAGVVCFLVARSGAEALMHVPPEALAGATGAAIDGLATVWKDKAIAKLEVPIGIGSGLAGGLLYNRFADIRLPGYLAFFGGRRFVPIVSGLAGLAIAGVAGSGYDALASAIDGASRTVATSGIAGLFLFGLLNRLLLVTGLHHILNNIAWFVVGDYHGTTGDLRRFFAGDPTAGGFMSGFFPVMIFGLPAACLAMYHTALPERRKAVGGLLLSLALTSMLTGVTEPIEFTFMFLAPLLYAIHAVLTGIAMALMSALGVHLGFGFSAGLLDYLLNYGKATRPWLLLPVGLAYAATYYLVFRFAIVRWDLKTPGREGDPAASGDAPAGHSGRGAKFVVALGGPGNLKSIGACTTRLRLIIGDQGAVDEARLKALGAIALLRPSPTALQVVLGPIADQVAAEMRVAADAAPPAPPEPEDGVAPRAAIPPLAPALLEALGGLGNVASLDRFHGRLRIRVQRPDGIDLPAILTAGARAAVLRGDALHILFEEARGGRLLYTE